jgi:hypothetical protein
MLLNQPYGALQIAQSYRRQTWLETRAGGIRENHNSYPQQAQLAQIPLPFRVQQWQPVGQFAAARTDSMSLVVDDITSGDFYRTVIGLNDAPFEATKTLGLAYTRSIADTTSLLLPPDLRNQVDRYLDRFYTSVVTTPLPPQGLHAATAFSGSFWENLLDDRS